MNTNQIEILKEKILNGIDVRQNKPYFSAIQNYCDFILKNPDSSNSGNHIFNILKNTGFIAMRGSKLQQNTNDIINQVLNLQISISPSAPSFLDFEDFYYELDDYKSLHKDFHKLPMPDQANLKNEETWEDMWWELEDIALKLIQTAIDITAIEYGYKVILNNDKKIKGFEESWKNFKNNSQNFKDKLYECEKLFYMFRNSIYKMMFQWSCMPEGEFYNFIQKITKYRFDYAKENCHRKLISPERADEIFFDIKEKFPDYPSAAWGFFYKAVLAGETIKDFVLSTCLAEEELASQWTSINIDNIFEHNIPMIHSGCQKFSIHMLDKPQLGGWGFRKDLIVNHLLPSYEYGGALLCSMKEYPSGNILVCFDNFIEKNRFVKLVQSKEEIYKNYIKLPFEDVYKEDLREKFIEFKVNSYLYSLEIFKELQKTFEALQMQKAMVNMVATVAICHKISQHFKLRKIEIEQSGDGYEPPEHNIIFIPENLKDKANSSFEFLPTESIQKKYKEILNLRTYIESSKDAEKWFSIAFFCNADGETIKKSKAKIEKGEPVKFKIPENTAGAIIGVGPVAELSKIFKPDNDKVNDIFWVIYGS